MVLRNNPEQRHAKEYPKGDTSLKRMHGEQMLRRVELARETADALRISHSKMDKELEIFRTKWEMDGDAFEVDSIPGIPGHVLTLVSDACCIHHSIGYGGV